MATVHLAVFNLRSFFSFYPQPITKDPATTPTSHTNHYHHPSTTCSFCIQLFISYHLFEEVVSNSFLDSTTFSEGLNICSTITAGSKNIGNKITWQPFGFTTLQLAMFVLWYYHLLCWPQPPPLSTSHASTSTSPSHPHHNTPNNSSPTSNQ